MADLTASLWTFAGHLLTFVLWCAVAVLFVGTCAYLFVFEDARKGASGNLTAPSKSQAPPPEEPVGPAPA